jgi:hypothetical protein
MWGGWQPFRANRKLIVGKCNAIIRASPRESEAGYSCAYNKRIGRFYGFVLQRGHTFMEA